MDKPGFWDESLIELQRQYWQRWSEISAVASGGKASKTPWELAQEHWWQALAPAAPASGRAFMERMMEQGAQLFRMAEMFSFADEGQKHPWQEIVDDLSSQMNTAAACGSTGASDQLQRLMGFWSTPLQGWQRMAAGLSFTSPESDDNPFSLQRMLKMPGFGVTREEQAQQQRLAQLVGDDVTFRRTEFVGPKVSEELLQEGLLAVGLALVFVLIYIWFRFEWQYGVGAIVALVHDVVMTIGMFAVTGLEVNLSTVAAVLTIVGYSLNDTVVIFDRVRENLRRYKTLPIIELIDQSINETLARTLMTSLTTLIALLSLFFFGGEVVKGFTFAMIWGIVIGTYSTIYIASPVLIYLDLRSIGQKKAADASQPG